MSATTVRQKNSSDLNWLMRLLVIIENVGNRLPHPFWLFLSLAVVVMLISWAAASAGLSAINPATQETVTAVNLTSRESLGAIVAGVVNNYVTFPALGLVLVVLFGVAVAERAGLIPVVMRVALMSASPRWVTAVVALVGTASSIASDAAYMIVIPLGGIAFKAVGRNPVIGCAVGYAATAGGYSAAPMVNGLDAILGGISTSAAAIIDPNYVVTPIDNFYFNFISMFVVAGAIVLVTELLLNKRGEELTVDDEESQAEVGAASDTDLTKRLTREEKRGIWAAIIATVICGVVLFALAAPASSFLRDDTGGLGPKSPLMTGIAPIIGFGFFVVGIVYGVTARTIKSPGDIPDMIIKGLEPMVPVLLLFFAASQFLALFKMSKLGEILAIKGAEFFQGANTPAFVILLGAYILTALGAMFITSGSGLWTLMAPVLIPMLMLLGIAPEITQAVYRIGDSTTNIISPMSPYFVMILGFVQRYKRDAGIGTLLSLTIPLSFAMFIAWGLLFFGWWATGIPMGPGADTTYQLP